MDFREAAHLPSRGFSDPNELPRQRKGVTPQLHGRYPDYNVLGEVDHWDEETRKVVLARVHDVPPFRFFDEHERDVLKAFCDTLLAQDAEPRVPVLSFVDEKLHSGVGDGYQFFDMPSDQEVWRRVAAGLDEEARALGVDSFVDLAEHHRRMVVHRFAQAELTGGVWATLNVSRAFSIVMRDACQAFYSHPWVWNEIGFGGPAYPRGYAAFGNPELGEREHWEGEEAFSRDPVKDTQEKGLD
jgi:gluconate 2-dehydrogenase subunit 3-like protein